MTEQEKIEIFANYLPYKVNLAVDTIYRGFTTELVISNHTNSLKNGMNINQAIEYEAKPKLRPLSDLTNPIKVDGYNDGNEFVPIVELAKIGQTFQSQSIDNWEVTKVSKDFGYGHNQYYVQFKDNYVFGYHEKHGFYSSSNRNKEMDINNQKEIWKMLYKWHVDIHGLIEKNIAVDINTLK